MDEIFQLIYKQIYQESRTHTKINKPNWLKITEYVIRKKIGNGDHSFYIRL